MRQHKGNLMRSALTRLAIESLSLTVLILAGSLFLAGVGVVQGIGN